MRWLLTVLALTLPLLAVIGMAASQPTDQMEHGTTVIVDLLEDASDLLAETLDIGEEEVGQHFGQKNGCADGTTRQQCLEVQA